MKHLLTVISVLAALATVSFISTAPAHAEDGVHYKSYNAAMAERGERFYVGSKGE